jgi:drug/metabolite transporter (DMT)-like permease
MPLHSASGRWRLGLLLTIVTMILWGVLPLALGVVLDVLDVYTIICFRFLCAFILLGIFLSSRQQLPPQDKLPRLGWLIAIAMIGLALNYLLFLQGLKQTSSTNAEILIQLAPVMMGIGGLVLFRERYILQQWLGLGILVSGLTLFSHDQIQVTFATPTYLIGNIILILAATAWSFYALAQKQLLKDLSSGGIMFLIYGGCMLLFTPSARPLTILELSPPYLAVLLFCGLNTLLAYGAFSEALEHLEASRVSALLALTPLVTIGSVWGFSLLIPNWVAPEPMTLVGFMGAILVTAGAVLVALGKSEIKQP